jgi:Na+/phosphate symporter
MTLLFFRTFLSLVVFLSSGWVSNPSVGLKLALVHTVFNAINLLFWWVFLPILVRLSRGILPDLYDSEYWLSALGVQKLLLRIPERALYETRNELLASIRAIDTIFLSYSKIFSVDFPSKAGLLDELLLYEQRRYEKIQEVLARLATRMSDREELKPQFYRLLEKSYKISRIIVCLENVGKSMDNQSRWSEICPVNDTREKIQEMLVAIQDQLDALYKSLANEDPARFELDSAQGAYLYQAFFEVQVESSGTKIQAIYGALLALRRELCS